MTSYENINKAINIVSDNLGVTMCQACYLMMGEDLYDVIPKLAGETKTDGYAAVGRLFAIGYLKGILDSTN